MAMVVAIYHFHVQHVDRLQASDFCSLSDLRHVSRSDNVGQMTCPETQDLLTSTFLLRLEEPNVFDPTISFSRSTVCHMLGGGPQGVSLFTMFCLARVSSRCGPVVQGVHPLQQGQGEHPAFQPCAGGIGGALPPDPERKVRYIQYFK